MMKFENVMAGVARMCKYMNQECYKRNCPLACKTFCSKPICSYTKEDIQEAEKIVAKWIAEHPESKYPTWGEWLYSQHVAGVHAMQAPLSNMYYLLGYPTWGEWLYSQHVAGVHAMQAPLSNMYYLLEDRINTPIPDDIAQKLGIEPKR